MKTKMKTKNEIKAAVKDIDKLCNDNKFREAGELARLNKSKFVAAIKSSDSISLKYAYKVCSYFNMRQTDCFNLIYS